MEPTIPNTNGVAGRSTAGATPQDAYRDSARENVQEARQQVVENARARGEELRTEANIRMESAKEKAMDLSQQAETTIRKRPWMALGVAALAGMAIAKLLS